MGVRRGMRISEPIGIIGAGCEWKKESRLAWAGLGNWIAAREEKWVYVNEMCIYNPIHILTYM